VTTATINFDADAVGSLDGKRYIDLDDERISGSGRISAWTKADSVTAFDDFSFGANACP